MTPKGQTRDPIIFEAPYLHNGAGDLTKSGPTKLGNIEIGLVRIGLGLRIRVRNRVRNRNMVK